MKPSSSTTFRRQQENYDQFPTSVLQQHCTSTACDVKYTSQQTVIFRCTESTVVRVVTRTCKHRRWRCEVVRCNTGNDRLRPVTRNIQRPTQVWVEDVKFVWFWQHRMPQSTILTAIQYNNTIRAVERLIFLIPLISRLIILFYHQITTVQLHIRTSASQNLRTCINFFNDINFFNLD